MSERCPACRSSQTPAAFRASGIEWVRCSDCASLFDPRPPEGADLRRIYEGAEYFVKPSDGAEGEGGSLWGYPADYLADRDSSEAKFDRVLAHLERYTHAGRLVDVGCGPGFLLSVAERRGWRATGVDLNDWAVGHARGLGLEAFGGTLAELGVGDAELSGLTMLDLFEHVPDGDELLAEAARVVRPEGAIAILTPDAGSAVSRALGRRWPEVRRPGEHAVLYSVAGLAEILARHGFAAAGWHSIGKTASLATLAADASPAAPGVARRVREGVAGTALGRRVVDFDPRTKFCLYARRLPAGGRRPLQAPVRVPRRPERLASVEGAIADELASLAEARRFCDWMFDGFAGHVHGDVAEVGAGIGTFSQRILGRGPKACCSSSPSRAARAGSPSASPATIA
ncbi:MAG: class I SAM-dependent methyltransferase [Solirubrobacterales bacterium]